MLELALGRDNPSLKLPLLDYGAALKFTDNRKLAMMHRLLDERRSQDARRKAAASASQSAKRKG